MSDSFACLNTDYQVEARVSSNKKSDSNNHSAGGYIFLKRSTRQTVCNKVRLCR